MASKKYILWILFWFFNIGYVEAQKKKSFNKTVPISNLEQARKIKSKDPNKAIRLIESLLKTRKRRGSLAEEAEAYMLLGSIYEEIDQRKLAFQRYEQAGKILDKIKHPELKAQNHLAMGLLSLDEGNTKLASTNFNACLNVSSSKTTRLKCEIGRADVEFLNENYDVSILLYNKIQQGYVKALDSLTLSNIEAKKAQIFVKKNKIDEARHSYFNSIKNYPTTLSTDEEEYETIENAKVEILTNLEDVDEKIELRKENIEYKENRNFSKQSIIQEQLELADLYLEKGAVEEAERYIDASKNLAEQDATLEQKVKVFKKATEISQQKGALDEAAKNYRNFSDAMDKANNAKQEDLDRKLAILKDQVNIDIIDKNLEIEEKQEALLEQQLKNQRNIIGLLSLLLLASLVSFYFIMRNVKAKRKANALLLLKSLRTQMNPHFIFNALNSVNNYISKNDEKAANKFLANFSRLMRMVLDYSQKDFISFEEEMQLIELYLKLEHARFRDKFDYKLENNTTIDYSDIEIPPMLIQPFIENAVWHGLRYKTEKGHLQVTIKTNDKYLNITIQDNGIGREKSKTLKTRNQKKYKSTGLKNVDKRIALINEIYTKNYEIQVKDAFSDASDVGTFVSIKIPL